MRYKKELYQKREKTRQKPNKCPLTDCFTAIVSSDLRVECVKEFRFHPVRKWRFDYAIPEYKIAIEIDGGVWNYGRHNRAAGYIADMEKFNAAASLGWVVLKFTPDEQYKSSTFESISKAVQSARATRNLPL